MCGPKKMAHTRCAIFIERLVYEIVYFVKRITRQLTASFSALPALNAGTFAAEI